MLLERVVWWRVKEERKMNKRAVQKRVLQNGEVLDLDLFSWDDKTNTFSSNEDYLVIEFNDYYNATVKTGSNATVTTGYDSTVTTGYYSTVTTGYNSTVKTRGYSTVKTGYYSTVKTGFNSTVTTGFNSTVKTGYESTVKTGDNSTVTAYDTCYINTEDTEGCILVLRDEDNTKVCNLSEYNSAKLTRFTMNDVIEKEIKEIKMIDESLMVLLATKEIDTFTTYKTQYIGAYFINNDAQYVVEKDDLYAHGETLKQAFKDLEFKILQSKDVKDHIT